MIKKKWELTSFRFTKVAVFLCVCRTLVFVVVYLGMRGIYFAALGAEGISAYRLWWEDLSGGVPMCWIRYLGLTSGLPGLSLFLIQ